MAVPEALISSQSVEHYTPRYIVDAARACMGGIDLDPASPGGSYPPVPARLHYTKEDDGLSRKWSGRVYLNPPFGPKIAVWFEHLERDYRDGSVTEVIVLWKAATETRAWEVLTRFCTRVCFPKHRINFHGPAPKSRTSSPFSPALLYAGPHPERFESTFSKIGPVWSVPPQETTSLKVTA